MTSRATRVAGYRRAMILGISVSVAAHVAALVAITVPGAGPGDADATASKSKVHPFDALEVVRLPEPREPLPTLPSPVVSASSADRPAPTATTTVPATTATGASSTLDAASIDALLASMPPARMTVSLPDASGPVVTFRDLERVSQSEAMLAQFVYGAGAIDEEDEGGGFGSLLGRIGLALSGGGHCPTPAGPMILR